MHCTDVHLVPLDAGNPERATVSVSIREYIDGHATSGARIEVEPHGGPSRDVAALTPAQARIVAAALLDLADRAEGVS